MPMTEINLGLRHISIKSDYLKREYGPLSTRIRSCLSLYGLNLYSTKLQRFLINVITFGSDVIVLSVGSIKALICFSSIYLH